MGAAAKKKWWDSNPAYSAEWRAQNPEYGSWKAMIQRCTNPNVAGWARYGGRGITVCDRWRSSYQTFREDLGPRPSPAHSIDRIDNSCGYEPGNVRWSTRSEQQRNKTSGVPVSVTDRIVNERNSGRSFRAIAAGLNADGIPTPRGKRWYGVTTKDCFVRAALDRPVT